MTPSALRCGVPRPACVAAARASRLGAWATRPGGACVLRCAAATSSDACFVCKRSSGARRCAPRLRPRRRADDRHGQGPEEGQDEGRGGQPVQGHGQPAADILWCERGSAAAAVLRYAAPHAAAFGRSWVCRAGDAVAACAGRGCSCSCRLRSLWQRRSCGAVADALRAFAPPDLRANSKIREPELQRWWADQRVYERCAACHHAPSRSLHTPRAVTLSL